MNIAGSILESINNKRKRAKGDKYWLIPVIAVGLSVVIMLTFFIKSKIEDVFNQVKEPWKKISVNSTVNKIENDESFVLFLYAEWCPFCKEAMFGDSEARDGSGNLLKWTKSRASNIDFVTFWEEEKNDTDALVNYINDVEDKLKTSTTSSVDDFNWRDNAWTYDEEKGVAERDLTFDKTRSRPGVPAFMYFNNGELKAVFSGSNLTNIGYDYFYKTFVDESFSM